jgi:hypothetical protein
MEYKNISNAINVNFQPFETESSCLEIPKFPYSIKILLENSDIPFHYKLTNLPNTIGPIVKIGGKHLF